MRLRLPSDQVAALREALRKARANEIGGQIFGEQLAPSDFIATQIMFQHRPGTIARFVVDLVQAARDAARFFDRTAHRYERFNYLGEWHSHPSFEVRPSGVDVATMRRLVHNPTSRGSFAVLLIVKLEDDQLRAGGWVFDTAGNEFAVHLEVEA